MSKGDNEGSSMQGSPAPSIYSYHPSVDEHHLLRTLHGRVFNSRNETYMLPADCEEQRRLDLEHRIYTRMLGSLVPAEELVKAALRPRNDFRPSILDLGTGSGSWALDMAKNFPHCDIIGIDLAPICFDGPLPENCRFEIDDANLGFPHYRSSFDVIHARGISAGINDFQALLHEFSDMLRPGGVVILVDGEMQLYDENKEPLANADYGEPGFSWTHKVYFSAYNATKSRGGNIDAHLLIPRWLASSDLFTNIGSMQKFLPIGSWVDTDAKEDRETADMLRANYIKYIDSMSPLFLNDGYYAEAVDKMQTEAKNELEDLRVHLYSRWSFAWAVKKS